MIASEFAVTHDSVLSVVTTTKITIAFTLHASTMAGVDHVKITLLVTDENG